MSRSKHTEAQMIAAVKQMGAGHYVSWSSKYRVQEGSLSEKGDTGCL